MSNTTRSTAEQRAAALDELLAAREAGDPARLLRARNALVERSMGLAIVMASKRRYSRLPMADRVQLAAVGMMRAAESWNPNLGAWSTHASSWIRHELARADHDIADVVRVPAHIQALRGGLARERRQLSQALGRDATDHELAEALALDVDRLPAPGSRPRSFDAPAGLDDDGTMHETHGTPAEDPLRALVIGELDAEVARIFDLLADDQADALFERFLEGQPCRGAYRARERNAKLLDAGLREFHRRACLDWPAERAALIVARLAAGEPNAERGGGVRPPHLAWLAEVLSPHRAAIMATFGSQAESTPVEGPDAAITATRTALRAHASQPRQPAPFRRPQEPHGHAADRPWEPAPVKAKPPLTEEVKRAKLVNCAILRQLGASFRGLATWFNRDPTCLRIELDALGVRAPARDHDSGVIGVHWNRGRWQATAGRAYVGIFDTLGEAVTARDAFISGLGNPSPESQMLREPSPHEVP